LKTTKKFSAAQIKITNILFQNTKKLDFDQRWAKLEVGSESEYGVFCRIRSEVGVRFLLIC